MNGTFLVRKISASDSYAIRNEVLRPGRPVTECHFSGDHDKETFHLGVFKDEKLIGVASFMKNSNPFFVSALQFQLRGMAILEAFKGKGLGSLLLKEGENKIETEHMEALLWFNARITAVDFYAKHAYKTFGEKFDIPGVCEHIIMFKQL